MAALLNLSLKQHQFAEARRYYGELARVGEVDADAEYDMACVEALADQLAAALAHLEAALKQGYRDWANLSTDPDLARLRSLPEYRKLVARYLGTPDGT